jgi:hypothetical protein
MKARCSNPKRGDYPRYGGRGIKVCKKWQKSFLAFKEDMGPKPDSSYTLDRIDNEKNYTPQNCRWATKDQQNFNKRTNRKIGPYGSVTQAARELGIPRGRIFGRLSRGWSEEDALRKT